MTPNQKIWSMARDQLSAALTSLGYPGEMADLLAGQLKSPGAMDRMTAYLRRARPASMEMIVDEMLAICADTESWRQKKVSEEAQAGYTAWLNSEDRRRLEEEP